MSRPPSQGVQFKVADSQDLLRIMGRVNADTKMAGERKSALLFHLQSALTLIAQEVSRAAPALQAAVNEPHDEV